MLASVLWYPKIPASSHDFLYNIRHVARVLLHQSGYFSVFQTWNRKCIHIQLRLHLINSSVKFLGLWCKFDVVSSHNSLFLDVILDIFKKQMGFLIVSTSSLLSEPNQRALFQLQCACVHIYLSQFVCTVSTYPQT